MIDNRAHERGGLVPRKLARRSHSCGDREASSRRWTFARRDRSIARICCDRARRTRPSRQMAAVERATAIVSGESSFNGDDRRSFCPSSTLSTSCLLSVPMTIVKGPHYAAAPVISCTRACTSGRDRREAHAPLPGTIALSRPEPAQRLNFKHFAGVDAERGGHHTPPRSPAW